jgi:putative membrane protein
MEAPMLIRLVVRLLVLAVIIGAADALISGIHVDGGFGTLVWLAFLFSVVNLTLGPVLRLLSLPLIVLTLGLFLLIVNTCLFALVGWLSSKLDIDNFGSAFLGALIITVFSWAAELLLPVVTPRRTRQ